MEKQKILMIAYCFPPVGGIGTAGSQRVLKFVKYLQDYKWEPVILTVQEQYYEPYFSMDYALLDAVPHGTKIIRTSVIRWLTKILDYRKHVKTKYASKEKIDQSSKVGNSTDFSKKKWHQKIKDFITDLFEIPDEEMGWFFPGIFAGIGVIRREQIDVIYSTGKPWTAHLIGTVLKFFTGKPMIADFRDPWLTNPFRPKFSVLRDRLETYLERKVIERADLVIANTDELKDEFIRRFPQQPQGKFIALLNGFDPEDCDGLEKEIAECTRRFTITHTGFLYGKRDPKIFIDAVRLLLDEKRVDPNNIRIALVGSAQLPYNLEEYLHEKGLDGTIIRHDYVPYKQSLKYMQNSDILLLLQPGTTTQIPSKLFEYIGMRKPILAISPCEGATYNLVIGESIGSVTPPDNIQEIAEAIYSMYQEYKNGAYRNNANEEAYKKFNVKNIVKALAKNLDDLSSKV